MGLFGGKDDTKQKIEELKAKMQGGGGQQQQPPQQPQQQQGWQPPQQPWQQQQQAQQPPQQQQQQQQSQQGWQPPRQQQKKQQEVRVESHDEHGGETGIILDLGDGMSLNLPIKDRMRLDEFLHIADRVRELKKIEHQKNY